MNISLLKTRVDELIELSNKVIATSRYYEMSGNNVDDEIFIQFRSSSLSFLKNTFGESNVFYKEFNSNVNRTHQSSTEQGRGILKAVKNEIEGGWIFTIKGLVSAEIFSDFLEMAEYLLKEGFKDPAAVMIGSVLEEHLRQLCIKNGLETSIIKEGKANPKKADLINAELTSIELYNKLDQKSITSWLDLRNKAAHGKYSEYTKGQVELMLMGVNNFMSRISI